VKENVEEWREVKENVEEWIKCRQLLRSIPPHKLPTLS
jgi:hypothetical protein